MNKLKFSAGVFVLFAACLLMLSPFGHAAESPDAAEAAAAERLISKPVNHDDRISRLSALYKMNVSGDAYLAACNKGKDALRTASYMANTQAVKAALIKEVGIVFKGLTEKQSKMAVERRRTKVMNAAFYHFDQRGCANSKAQAARTHVVKMGKMKASAIWQYLRDIK